VSGLPKLRWYDNPILWLGAQALVFFGAVALVEAVLPSGTSRWVEAGIWLVILAAVSLAGIKLLRRLRART
jgi:hypothetical protein